MSKFLAGIYKIENLITKDFYIGSTINFSKRKSSHWERLRSNTHHSPILQNSWNKHGESCFSMYPILYCDVENLLAYEQLALDILRPRYNISPTAASCRGVKHSEEFKQKVSLAKKGIPHRNKRAKISFSPERRAGCSRPGSNHGGALLTESKVIAIRSLVKENILWLSDIAELFNVTLGTIHDIRYHRSWTHIPDDNIYPSGKTKKRNMTKQERLSMSICIKEMP